MPTGRTTAARPAIEAAATSIEAVALPVPASIRADATRRERAAAIYELTKPRITRLVTITSGVGFTLAGVGRAWNTLELILAAAGCVVGTALSASGANALNQWMERSRDAVMPRTAHRPLPRAMVSPRMALAAGLAFSATGVLTLLLLAGAAPAAISLATILIYLLAYTPLKPITPLNTLVGAVPGALPPLIGWTAASGAGAGTLSFASLAEPGGWSLFLLMVVWQIPHFLAIAWMYRDDYAAGGYRMLPINDPTGVKTAATILLWAAALIPATVWPGLVLRDRMSVVYPLLAAVTGLAFLALCIRLARSRTVANARSVFLASIIHLPLLLVAMVADALIVAL